MEVQFLRIKQGEIMIEYTILKITRQMEAEGNIHSIYTQWLSGKESPCSSGAIGNTGLISGSRISPGQSISPLQDSGTHERRKAKTSRSSPVAKLACQGIIIHPTSIILQE